MRDLIWDEITHKIDFLDVNYVKIPVWIYSIMGIDSVMMGINICGGRLLLFEKFKKTCLLFHL